ncbi:hypothetical protein JCM19046_2755 [Bacillus sp. JCM 19046]|nr:hypothetical protein JCM19045_1560 [Bacillus sp. JCM 19045]GAF18194.1 hypothetical protein JCM19046_2755 [Bacillus sp. JCM 19046]
MGEERVLVLHNVSGAELTVEVEALGELYYSSKPIKKEQNAITLAPYSSGVYQKQ